MMLIFLARTHETNIDPGLIGRALAHQLEKTKRVARVGGRDGRADGEVVRQKRV